jgi:hypothetical protein
MRVVVLFVALSTLTAGAGPKQLFNGKNLAGWVMTGPGRFVVEDGVMKTEGGMGLLYYQPQKFGNCTIRVVFRAAAEHANSGVVIRLPEEPPDPWYGVHNGYEVQIDAAQDEWHSTGAIYSLSKVTARAQKPQGQWNTMDIVLKGPITTVVLNGTTVNVFDPSKPVPARKQWFEPVRGPRPDVGYLGLQNHDAQAKVQFREISVR